MTCQDEDETPFLFLYDNLADEFYGSFIAFLIDMYAHLVPLSAIPFLKIWHKTAVSRLKTVFRAVFTSGRRLASFWQNIISVISL